MIVMMKETPGHRLVGLDLIELSMQTSGTACIETVVQGGIPKDLASKKKKSIMRRTMTRHNRQVWALNYNGRLHLDHKDHIS